MSLWWVMQPLKDQERMLYFRMLDAGRMLLFTVEELFLLMEFWLMHNVDTQCTVQGERKPKVREFFV